MQERNTIPHDAQRQQATEYLRAEDNNPRILLADWAFKLLFRFFSVTATLLGMLSVRRDRPVEPDKR